MKISHSSNDKGAVFCYNKTVTIDEGNSISDDAG